MKGDAKRGATISFGSYALKALDQHWITDRQIEAARQALTREMKRRVMCGFAFSLTNQLPASLQR